MCKCNYHILLLELRVRNITSVIRDLGYAIVRGAIQFLRFPRVRHGSILVLAARISRHREKRTAAHLARRGHASHQPTTGTL